MDATHDGRGPSIPKAIDFLDGVLAPGKAVLVATVLGRRSRLVSNAHKTQDHGTFVHCFEVLDLVEFALTEGRGLRADHGTPVQKRVGRSCGGGRFWLRKPRMAPLAFRR